MDVDFQVSLLLDVRLQVSHLKVIVHPVNHKVREPRIFALTFKQTTEQFQGVLSEVISKHLE
jgi:hypothetical protein